MTETDAQLRQGNKMAGGRVISLALFTALAFSATSPNAAQFACAENLRIHCDRQTDVTEAVCDGAKAATAFLRNAGFDTSRSVTIKIVEYLPVSVDPNAIACYVHSERCVYLLAPATPLPPTGVTTGALRALRYRSRAAHEMAHAIAADNFRVQRPTIQAHEYIAYVTMFATMPEAARVRMLDGLPGEGFDNDQQISATLFLLAPNWFGAEAYRHYRSLDYGPAFLRRVLSGEALGGANGW